MATQRIGAALWPKLPTVQIYGANTDVGKTIVSTLLCCGMKPKGEERIHYIKPVSTGPLNEADNSHISRFAPYVASKTLFQFSKPLSPHLAARQDGRVLPDAEIQHALYKELASRAALGQGRAIVETAGGVLSPAPSGSTQADLYRPLRLPVILVGDSHLGGIATTISAYESLRLRGYDVDSVVLFEDDVYGNKDYLSEYFSKHNIHTFGLKAPPPQQSTPEKDLDAMRDYYETTSRGPSGTSVSEICQNMMEHHVQRGEELKNMAEEAHTHIWYPFTQHQGRSEKDILTIDSAYGDDFQSFSADGDKSSTNALTPSMDGSASWWTQGLGHGNLDLSMAAAYAAGRYGHVMFASAVNEPAIKVVKSLLKGHNNERLEKVFFSDNGSTGMEVAIKMALRATCERYGWDHRANNIKVLGLRGSYHGDTMGVMDASEPSVYNEKIEWYNPRGYWFEYPEVRMRKGKWYVEPPKGLEHILGDAQEYSSLDEILAHTERSDVKEAYKMYIEGVLSHLVERKGYKFGGLVLEPMILGAGGMHFADPLFQQTLIEMVRERPELINPALSPQSKPSKSTDWSGLPVVFDEVFTGLYRLSQFNCNKFLNADPDIVANAKLLTGGLVPLCTTAASQSIFNAFLSDSKAEALLHGHSYTAHPVGCNVAQESLKTLQKLDETNAWKPFKDSWNNTVSTPYAWSMWSKPFVETLSFHDSVDHVFALGNVLAIAFKDAGGSGYTSTASQGLHKKLLQAKDGWSIHNRVLGNVIYFMTGQMSTPEQVKQVEDRIMESIE